MRELGFALVGALVYALVWSLLVPLIGSAGGSFLMGYMFVAVVDLWRCWRSVQWTHSTLLEVAIAALLLFPLGSLLWLPWDLQQLFHYKRAPPLYRHRSGL